MATGVTMVAFREVKAGNEPHEWEDRVCYGEATGPGTARCIVLDGATEAYDAVRWVDQLAESFIGTADEIPVLDDAAFGRWFALMQQRWLDQAPAEFVSVFEERKFHEDGSFATMLCCEINGLDGPQPSWRATALGDTVLFHVRDGALLEHFPPLTLAEFGVNPDGVYTKPDALERMRARLSHARGRLLPGDRLYVATDALAEWILRRCLDEHVELWQLLAELNDRAVFSRLVSEQRAAGALKNDDVTLMRAEVSDRAPDFVVVSS